MVELHSEADNIENTAQAIMDAFKSLNVQEGETMQYQELYPYLQEHYPHYKDVQKEAEQHLTKAGFVNPAPDGLMLTQVGAANLYSNNS